MEDGATDIMAMARFTRPRWLIIRKIAAEEQGGRAGVRPDVGMIAPLCSYPSGETPLLIGVDVEAASRRFL